MNKVEILAPAGSKESFIGAINAGCNAIYMAGYKYGARAYASNFSLEEFKELINYAHLRDVKIYVTINTLIFNDELDELLKYTDELVKYHVDAFIVQDLGLISIFCKRYPNLDIHASTQVNTHNLNGVLFLKSLGVKRIILARETPLEIIKEIKDKIDIEIEVFVHGALCVSYSGNCLMSRILNNRSGNRGECNYSCRLPYQLLKDKEVVNNETYLLSSKDLMTLEYVDKLIEAKIDSFKIEGRMRKKEYVTQLVLSYKKAVDNYYQNKKIDYNFEIDKIKRVFNREFTKGFILNELPRKLNNNYRPNHIGVKIGQVLSYNFHKKLAQIKLFEDLENGDGYRIIGNKDYGNIVTFMTNKNNEIIKKAFKDQIIYLEVKEKVNKDDFIYKTSDKKLEDSLDIYQDINYKLIKIKGYVKAFINNKLIFKVIDDINNEVEFESNDILQQANNKPLKEEDYYKLFNKLGNTPFYFEKLNIYTDNKTFILVKDVNELRRKVIDKLIELRIKRDEIIINNNYVYNNNYEYFNDIKIVCKVHNYEQLEECIKNNINEIYYDDTLDITKYKINYQNIIFRKAFKRINFNNYNLENYSLINDFSGLYLNKDNKYNLVTDEFLNVTNIYTSNLLLNNNVKRITLSSELNLERILNFSNIYYEKFNNYPNLELVVYGYKDLMISKYCPISKTFNTNPHCNLCYKNQYYLKNNNRQFPLINDGNCNIRILNYESSNLFDNMQEIINSHINTLRLDFTIENKIEVNSIINKLKKIINI